MPERSQLADLDRFMAARRASISQEDLIEQWLEERAKPDAQPPLTAELLQELSLRRGMWQGGLFLTPAPLARFIAELAAAFDPESILDPVCGAGYLLDVVAKRTSSGTIHGLDIDRRLVRRARAVLDPSAKVMCGDALGRMRGLAKQYDVIVADAPLAMRLRPQQGVLGLRKGSRCEFGHALAAWACARLSDHGAAFIVVTPAFLWGRGARDIQRALASTGGRIRALIHLPGGSLRHTRFQAYLAVVDRGAQGDVWIAQLSTDDKVNTELVSNFRRCTQGPEAALGRVAPLSKFHGFHALVARERLHRLARAAGWDGMAARDIILAHDLTVGADTQPAGDALTCYLGVRGTPKAALNLASFEQKSRPRDVVRLSLNAQRVDATYLVHWLNCTEVGRATLATLVRGSALSRIDPEALMDAKLYLPALEQQQKIAGALAHLEAVRARVEELSDALSQGGPDVRLVVDQIYEAQAKDRLDDWMQALPFPLASILWRYHAGSGSYHGRCDTLLRFFEATAAFLAIIHIGAFQHDVLWVKHEASLKMRLRQGGEFPERAAFGDWRKIQEAFSSACQQERRCRDSNEAIIQTYATASERVLDMLCSASVKHVLQQANKVRNTNFAHGGVIGDERARSLHAELSDLLQKLRTAFGRTWLDYRLVRPSEGRFRAGEYNYNAEILMGPHGDPFREERIALRHALEDGSLYLYDAASRTALQLPPLVRVERAAQRHAMTCYMFNRVEGEQAKFVSHHYEQEPELLVGYQAVSETLERLASH